MDVPFVESLSDSMPSSSRAVVSIVYDYLTSAIEEIPDELFAFMGDLGPDLHRLRAFLPYTQSRLGPMPDTSEH